LQIWFDTYTCVLDKYCEKETFTCEGIKFLKNIMALKDTVFPLSFDDTQITQHQPT
jgi:hypothetical protein